MGVACKTGCMLTAFACANKQQFERTLSEVVASEKLSGSRVERVRSEAAREFHVGPVRRAKGRRAALIMSLWHHQHGEAVAKAIQRVHMNATDKSKISSLYLFDAMSRYAQDVIRRRASGFEYKESRPPRGSSASPGSKEAMIDAANTFLSACSTIVEDIVLSTARAVRADQRVSVALVR